MSGENPSAEVSEAAHMEAEHQWEREAYTTINETLANCHQAGAEATNLEVGTDVYVHWVEPSDFAGDTTHPHLLRGSVAEKKAESPLDRFNDRRTLQVPVQIYEDMLGQGDHEWQVLGVENPSTRIYVPNSPEN